MNTRMHKVLILVINVMTVLALGFGQASYASAARKPKTLTAWGKVELTCKGAVNLPWGMSNDTTFTLENTRSAKVRYKKTLKSGSNGVVNGWRKGTFGFNDVPTGEPMMLTIKVNGVMDSSSKIVTYKFYYPKWATRSRVKKAGYMGKFQIDICTSDIRSLD